MHKFIRSLVFCYTITTDSQKKCITLIYISGIVKILLTYFNYICVRYLFNDTSIKSFQNLKTYVLAICVIQFAESLFNVLDRNLSEQLNITIQSQVREAIIEKTIRTEISNYDDPIFLDMVQTANYCSNVIPETIMYYSTLINSVVSLIASTALVIHYKYECFILLIITCIPLAVTSNHYLKRKNDLDISLVPKDRKKNYYEYLSSNKKSVKEIQALNIESIILDIIKKLNNETIASKLSLLKERNKTVFLADIFRKSVILITIRAFLIKLISGEVNVGDVSMMFSLLSSILSSADLLIDVINNLYDCSIKNDKLRTLLNYQLIPPYSDKQLNINEITEIEFRNVCFNYPNSLHKALNNVSFTIKSGDKICFVGENGSGKSTILKLLLRFYAPCSGEILINKQNIASYNVESLRDAISGLSQDYLVFPETIEFNIQIGNDNHQNEINKSQIGQLFNCTGSSNLWNKLKSSNMTMFKIFDINGYEPSAGEIQKIAIIRTLYRDKSLLFLDEATCNLDTISQNKIYKYINDRSNKQILMYVTHHLSQIDKETNIIVLKNGAIVEEGCIDDLISKKGEFYRLYEMENRIDNNV